MLSLCKMSKYGSSSLSNPHQYMPFVGALHYITLTRHGIAISVNKACKHMIYPSESHWLSVKRILHYLNGTISHGLLFAPASLPRKFSLWAYTDFDWDNDPDNPRSTSGSCIFFGPNLLSWRSKEQPLVARATLKRNSVLLLTPHHNSCGLTLSSLNYQSPFFLLHSCVII